jgi:hypothetical protein
MKPALSEIFQFVTWRAVRIAVSGTVMSARVRLGLPQLSTPPLALRRPAGPPRPCMPAIMAACIAGLFSADAAATPFVDRGVLVPNA